MKTSNWDLEPLPGDNAVVIAVKTIVEENRKSPSMLQFRGATANGVARFLRVRGARRAGNGAVKGSWSGTMSPATRIAPRLRSLAERGDLERSYDAKNYRYEYYPKGERFR